MEKPNPYDPLCKNWRNPLIKRVERELEESVRHGIKGYIWHHMKMENSYVSFGIECERKCGKISY